MTGLGPSIIATQPFFRTGEHPCPYLPNRAGFRRSHRLGYRPACPHCAACLPVRIVAPEAVRSRSLRRIARLNADLTLETMPPVALPEHFDLFHRYEAARHAESDMAAMGWGDYRMMIEDSPIETGLYVLRDGAGTLLGVCLYDRLDDGDSAVYSFFDPDQPKRSLGTHLVMALINAVCARGADYVYLGYWVPGSRKMDYKRRFHPLEALGPQGWRRVDVG
jgi:arginine-tRNA-protein transferase